MSTTTMTSAMYTGISGLTVHSRAISVVGNNLANANTVGFKSSSIQFEDIFYSTVNTSSGLDQVGHGATVSTIYNDFSQGSYETSSLATDVAISGQGFFIVDDPITRETYYTRAGDFSFDEDGYLINSSGYRVQGWSVDSERSANSDSISTEGALGDIKIENLQSAPNATSLMSLLVNLDKDSEEASANATDPFFALQQEWDGTADEPLTDNSYTYQATLTVFDEAGAEHEITVYFDPVQDETVTDDAGGDTVWEFIVTCDPDDDGRVIDGQDVSETSSAGLLMTGTLTFNASGQLESMTAFTLDSTATGDLHDLTNWTPAEINDDGNPVFTANFSQSSNASATDQDDALEIGLSFGIRDRTPTSNTWVGAVADASLIGTDISNLFNFEDPVYDANATTSYESSSSTLTKTQDGYAAGFLESLSIDSNGVISGYFSNGETIDLYVIGLADFANYQGLNSEGGNLYSETSESGIAITGIANTNGFGSIESGYLEQSNVDYSSEMVDLIRFQRGYQANSKVITTVDSLLQEAINLKR